MRALIVDDHAGFRATARAMLTEAGHDVVGEAADGESTMSVFDAVSPDLVVLDVQLPDTDGFAVAHLLGRQTRPPLVVLVTARNLRIDARRAATAPVVGLLLKEKLTGVTLNALLRHAASP